MATISAIKIQLAGIHYALGRMPVFVSGRPDSDTEAAKQADRLDDILRRLNLILRDLATRDSGLRLRSENIRKVPPEHRWSEKDSVKQQAREVSEVTAEAQRLADFVKTLLARNGLITPIQAGKKTMDLLQELEKNLPVHTKASTIHRTDQPIYTAPAADSLHLESLGTLVTFVLLAIKYWKEKSSAKKT